jgi:aspartate 1-decarboxylase
MAGIIRQFITAKLHGITVTAASVEYIGSVTIGAELLDAAGIQPYERVHIVNLNTGGRWDTYALPGDNGVFTLNGGGARLGVVGDRCVVMTYGLAEQAPGATVVFCGDANKITDVFPYPAGETVAHDAARAAMDEPKARRVRS